MTNKELETIIDKLENRVRELERLQEVKELIESETKDDENSTIDKDKRIARLEEENNLLKTYISKYNPNFKLSSRRNFKVSSDKMRFNILNGIIDRNIELITQLHDLLKKICDEIKKMLSLERLEATIIEQDYSTLVVKWINIVPIIKKIQAKYENGV